jgi:hypothetical protein
MSDISEIYRSNCRKVPRLGISIGVTFMVLGRENPLQYFFLDPDLKRVKQKYKYVPKDY